MRQGSTLHLYLKDRKHSLEENDIHILDREDRWFGRALRKKIYMKQKKQQKTRVKRGGDLRFHLSTVQDKSRINLALLILLFFFYMEECCLNLLVGFLSVSVYSDKSAPASNTAGQNQSRK